MKTESVGGKGEKLRAGKLWPCLAAELQDSASSFYCFHLLQERAPVLLLNASHALKQIA